MYGYATVDIEQIATDVVVMKRMRCSLGDFLRQCRRLRYCNNADTRWKSVADRILKSVKVTLEEMHKSRHKLAHRDLHSDNIMLTWKPMQAR